MASLNDYATLSARVYWDSRRRLNINPLPSTWTEIAYSSDMANNPFSSGFTGGAYALMAGRSYQATRQLLNLFPIPSGWIEFLHAPDPLNPGFPTADGFEA
jgi:hypothetical protein